MQEIDDEKSQYTYKIAWVANIHCITKGCDRLFGN